LYAARVREDWFLIVLMFHQFCRYCRIAGPASTSKFLLTPQSFFFSAARKPPVEVAKASGWRVGGEAGPEGVGHGIDGKILFRDDLKASKAEQIIIQVKGGKTGVKDMRDLRGVPDRDKAAMGVLMSL
jgi:hypothetical protein